VSFIGDYFYIFYSLRVIGDMLLKNGIFFYKNKVTVDGIDTDSVKYNQFKLDNQKTKLFIENIIN